jgi:glycosyltransferase involved in cell wall biosynthesis
MARVTVVTAAYNAEPYIAETIESVLAQTYTDFDYVVVDDGSTDRTAEVAARYGPRVTCIRQQNAGTGAARNRGFELAAGEYVAVVDADDVWAPDKLERQVHAMDRDPDAGLCYTNASSVRADGSVCDTATVRPHPPVSCLMVMTGRNPLITSTVMYRRRFLEARPYRTDLPVVEDYHLHLKVLWRSGERSVFVDEPLVRYRITTTSVLGQAEAWDRGRLTFEAVHLFLSDMDDEKPVPADLQRRAVAYAHLQWAWYCISGKVAYRCAIRGLLRALRGDWRLGPSVARQFAKLSLIRLGWR